MKNFLLKFYPEITGLLVFTSYMFTIGPSVGENDSGELAMAQATLSIPHPTGYPLFVLIGYLFNQIPLPFSVIFKLNLLNAIWCSLTVIIVIRIASLLLQNFYLLLNVKGRAVSGIVEFNSSEKVAASVFSGLMLAFSATFWFQSTRVEVYSLQIFLTSVIILLTLRIFINYSKEQHIRTYSIRIILTKWWILFVFIGFGFSNHLMTLYLLPATLIIFFFCEGLNKKSITSVLLLFIISGLVAFLFYFGLMLRAQMNPPWSYGDTSSFKSLFEHVTAKEYTKYMMQGFESVKEQGSVLLKMLSFNFSQESFSAGEFSVSILFGIAGLLLLFLIKKEVALYFVFIVFVSIILAFSYKIPDINEYFLVPFLVLSVLSIIPVVLVIKIIRSKKTPLLIFYTFLVLMILSQFAINFNYANRSNAYIFEDFYKESISGLNPNSVLLTDSWSTVLSPGFYFRDVENIRRDVSIISPSGVILHEWYRKKQKIEILDSNNVIILQENLFISFDVIKNLIRKGIISLPPKSVLVPYLYYYRLEYDDIYSPLEEKEFAIRFNENPYNQFDAYIYSLIPFMMEQRILYELRFNQTEKASSYYESIKRFFRDYNISEITIFALNRNGIITY